MTTDLNKRGRATAQSRQRAAYEKVVAHRDLAFAGDWPAYFSPGVAAQDAALPLKPDRRRVDVTDI